MEQLVEAIIKLLENYRRMKIAILAKEMATRTSSGMASWPTGHRGRTLCDTHARSHACHRTSLARLGEVERPPFSLALSHSLSLSFSLLYLSPSLSPWKTEQKMSCNCYSSTIVASSSHSHASPPSSPHTPTPRARARDPNLSRVRCSRRLLLPWPDRMPLWLATYRPIQGEARLWLDVVGPRCPPCY